MFILYQNLFYHKDSRRRLEFDHCLKMNLLSFDKIFIFAEPKVLLPQSDKLIITKKDKVTFNDFFKATQYSGIDDLNVIANSDIFFNRHELNKIQANINDNVFALSRWDIFNFNEENAVLFDRDLSQDSWIKKGPFFISNADFGLGLGGCDNRIASILSERYVVKNPSKSIKSFHVHKAKQRDWHSKPKVLGPYKRLTPEEL